MSNFAHIIFAHAVIQRNYEQMQKERNNGMSIKGIFLGVFCGLILK